MKKIIDGDNMSRADLGSLVEMAIENISTYADMDTMPDDRAFCVGFLLAIKAFLISDIAPEFFTDNKLNESIVAAVALAMHKFSDGSVVVKVGVKSEPPIEAKINADTIH